MNYPLISEYVEAIKAAEDNFEQLKNLRPVLGEDGEPVMTSGNFAVVFKMKDEQTGKLHAVKCFLKEQKGRAEAYRMIAEELEYVSSTFLTPIKYLDKELFVDSANSEDSEFPILLMDWIEGQTLDKYIQKYVYRYQRAENLDETMESQEKAVELLENGYELENIAYQFSCLAIWLLQQPFAHGDLKPDNIIVKNDGTLVLVDYDGMYVPAMKGQRARELGSPDFRHPLRNENDFDKHIDDFPLSSILLSLLAIANEPSLWEKYGGDGRLLLSERDYRNIAESEVLDALRPLMADKNLTTYLSLFYLCSAQKSLFKESYHLFTLPEPKKPSFMEEDENLSTKVTKEDLANAWTDEFGVKYSTDKKRLLCAPKGIKDYSILEGTKVICDGYIYSSYPNPYWNPTEMAIRAKGAFIDCNSLKTISIPKSIRKIGSFSFSECKSLSSIDIPDSVTYIGERAFSNCWSLIKVAIPDSVTAIGDEPFYNCKKLEKIDIPNNITKFGIYSGCCNIKEISIPGNIIHIPNRAFVSCTELSKISIPESIISIGDEAFSYCIALSEICIPGSVKKIGKKAFANCKSLRKIIIPNSVTTIEEYAFIGCESLSIVIFSDFVLHISEMVFYRCHNLKNIFIPKGTKTYYEEQLPDYKDKLVEQDEKENLSTEVTDEDLANAWTDVFGVKYSIDGKRLLKAPNHLTVYNIKKGTIVICDRAFSYCTFLKQIFIPDSVTQIGSEAFEDCSSFREITIPNSVKKIGVNPFVRCEQLETLICNSNYFEFKEGAFYTSDYKILISYINKDCSFTIPDSVIKVGDEAFSFCESLQQINIPGSVIQIGNDAFSFCESLQQITIPDSVKQIGTRAFYGCGCLDEIVISQSVKQIRNNTFSWCTSLQQITIPDSVMQLEDEAFEGCKFLKQITIPDSVKQISLKAFNNCESLTHIIIPIGTKSKFAKMLPKYKDMLVEHL